MKRIIIDTRYFILPSRNAKYRWKTGSGSNVPVSQMETRHIINTLRCIDGYSRTKISFPRNGKGKTAWRRILNDELQLRKQRG